MQTYGEIPLPILEFQRSIEIGAKWGNRTSDAHAPHSAVFTGTLCFEMGLFGKLQSAKKVMDTIPQVKEPWHLILFIVNIILPGRFWVDD